MKTDTAPPVYLEATGEGATAYVLCEGHTRAQAIERANAEGYFGDVADLFAFKRWMRRATEDDPDPDAEWVECEAAEGTARYWMVFVREETA